MNHTEQLYADHLNAKALAGEILGWKFERIVLVLEDEHDAGKRRIRYEPDFIVFAADGSVEIHEVKGFLEDDALIKFQWARREFPNFKFIMIRRKGDAWEQIRGDE